MLILWGNGFYIGGVFEWCVDLGWSGVVELGCFFWSFFLNWDCSIMYLWEGFLFVIVIIMFKNSLDLIMYCNEVGV